MPSQSAPVFALIAQGAKYAVLGERVFSYGAGQFVVASTELPVIAHVSEASPATPYLVLGLALRPPLIAELLLDDSTVARRAGGGHSGQRRAATTCSTWSCGCCDCSTAPTTSACCGRRSSARLVWRLLTSEQGGTVRQIGLGDGNIVQIERAIRWIREHHADLFRVEDVARAAGMSVTSLHRHFRAVTTMTPIQFQKLIRLQEARARLLAEPGDVAGVGFAVGYDSASQFSREYRRLFGLPPGQDAARLSRVDPAQLADV